MTTKLPVRLKKEPLIDAIFEVRFTASAPAVDVIPGFLYGKLEEHGSITRLPAAELPKPIRDHDQNLQFAPLVKLDWKQFSISIGDRALTIGCKLPYPGWAEFKPAILKITSYIQQLGIIKSVHRHSMKYIDLIPSDNIADQISKTQVSISVGDHAIENEHFSLRMELPKDGLIHVINIVTSAVAQLQDGSKRQGLIVDVDTIANVGEVRFDTWLEQLPDSLDTIHLGNKETFFDCLKAETIESLEPDYE